MSSFTARARWAIPVVVMMLTGCSDCGGSSIGSSGGDHPSADERVDEPGADVRAAYDTVRKVVSKIGNLRSEQRENSPAMAAHRVACEVDDKLRLHVLRLSGQGGLTHAGAPEALEYAVLGGDTPAPSWRTIASVYEAAAPELLVRGETIVGGVIGTMNPRGEDDKGFGSAFLTFDIGTGATQPGVCTSITVSSVRMAGTPDGWIFALSRQYAPILEENQIGLRLYKCRDGESERVTNEVPGSYHPGSLPRDYAIHVGADGNIHIVYDGVRGDAVRGNVAPSNKHLWRVTLDPSGTLVSHGALGPGAELPYLTRIFGGPDGELYVLEVYGKRRDPRSNDWRFGHRVVKLGVAAREPGRRMRFFVDPWLQVHSVWFDSSEPRYYGPVGPP